MSRAPIAYLILEFGTSEILLARQSLGCCSETGHFSGSIQWLGCIESMQETVAACLHQCTLMRIGVIQCLPDD